MRFVGYSNLEEGMVLAEDIQDETGILYLKKGQRLTEKTIDNLETIITGDFNYNGVYVSIDNETMSKEKTIIKKSFREETNSTLNYFFESINENSLDDVKKKIKLIIDEIMTDEEIVYNMIDLKLFDEYTYQHSINVAILSIILGNYYGLSEVELKDLGLSAILHDIGKIFIPDELLNKKDKLSNIEYEIIQKHVEKGYSLLKENFNLEESILEGILDHHERWDGTGYPNQKKGNDISLYGQIIAIADVYDAMTSNRPYRTPLKPHKIYEYILSQSEKMFAYEIVKIFASKVSLYPINATVYLSNGKEGVVLENHFGFLTRPTLLVEGEKIALKEEYLNVTIIDCVF